MILDAVQRTHPEVHLGILILAVLQCTLDTIPEVLQVEGPLERDGAVALLGEQQLLEVVNDLNGLDVLLGNLNHEADAGYDET